ncbi:hypothetical protein C8A00DRAFT_42032 [Chaetomidium leptoderma]|uniref:Uncharacterized protein n=1 Tax=Chaetomidium leptoderma TaxID=669021 RepID=A0AAN6VQ21_9PEZI|nr:hypothetical protein C8A00DRAFT_42032 [Chaetomidium leptoderma]
MSSQANVGNPKASETGSGTRYHEGTANSHLLNDPKDQRSLSNRAAAEVSLESQESDETALHKQNPTLPAKMHGNEPSMGAQVDAAIQAEEEEILKKKGGENMPGKKM